MNMKFFYTTLLTLFLTQLAFAQDFTIRGFVYDKKNGEPMPFEKVRLLAMDSSAVTGDITDVNGFYSMSKLNAGEYIIKVESALYQTITRTVTAESQGILDIEFLLEKKAFKI